MMAVGRAAGATLTTVALIFGAASALAQESRASSYLSVEGMDFDTLSICAVIYQGVATFARERPDEAQGDPRQLAEDMSGASRAYAAAAYHVLSMRSNAPGEMWPQAEARMEQVANALAEQAGGSDGALAMMEDWVPYCDTLGPSVSDALAVRERQGW